MREKITVIFAGIVLAMLLPVGITMVMTGVVKEGTELSNHYESGKTIMVDAVGEVKTLDLETFLVQVLAAQISPDSEMESLKAQAVIARTTLRKQMADMTTIDSASLGMTYLTEAECKRQWGEKRYYTYLKRLQDAVIATMGQTITYDGELIDALYHAVSMGNTISAMEAYGKEIPYLQSVACSGDVESASYMQVQTFTWDEMKIVLNTLAEDGKLNGFSLEVCEQAALAERIVVTEATEQGYVKSVTIGGIVVAAEDFMVAAGLQSHIFYVEIIGEQIRVICLGKGHGLGLSQYTANKMAVAGSNYEEILTYFYPGTVVTPVN